MTKIKNVTTIDKQWGGNIFPAGAEYTVQEVDRTRLISDDQFIVDLYNNLAVVYRDGSALSPEGGEQEIRYPKLSMSDNFGYEKVIKSVSVPVNQQMIVFKEILLDTDGELKLDGNLILIE